MTPKKKRNILHVKKCLLKWLGIDFALDMVVIGVGIFLGGGDVLKTLIFIIVGMVYAKIFSYKAYKYSDLMPKSNKDIGKV